MSFAKENQNEAPDDIGLKRRASQYGGGLLPIVAVVGMVMASTQGTIYYKAKTSHAFLTQEKNKVLAQQVAEAGIEDAISELGSRRLTVTEGMDEYVVAEGKEIGDGSFTTKLSAVSLSSTADTVDLVSQGQAKQKSQTIQARLRLRNVYDSAKVVIGVSVPVPAVRFDTTVTTNSVTTVQDPSTVPVLNTTPAYAACFASSAKKCDVCHLPGGDVSKANVINISKSAINTHVDHHGDYVTTDGTCDIYQPKVTTVTTTTIDTVNYTVTNLIYDTAMTVDTLVRVQVLSWR